MSDDAGSGPATSAADGPPRLPLEINPPPQSAPLSPLLPSWVRPPVGLSFREIVMTVGVIIVSWAVLSTPEARRKVLRLLCVPRWVVRSVRMRRRGRRRGWWWWRGGGDGAEDYRPEYDFYYDRDDDDRGLSQPKLEQRRIRYDDGGRDGKGSRVHLTRTGTSPPNSQRQLELHLQQERQLQQQQQTAQHLHGSPPHKLSPRRVHLPPSPVDEQRSYPPPPRHSNSSIWPATGTSLCTGLILPDEEELREETDHDRFVRSWNAIKLCPYARLVLPPECRRVDPPKGKKGQQAGTAGGESGEKAAGGDADGGAVESAGSRSKLYIIRLLGRIWTRLKNVVTYDYVGLTVKVYMRVLDALRYRRDKRLGRPTAEEEDDDDDEDEDDEDDADDEGSLASTHTASSMASRGSQMVSNLVSSWTQKHRRQDSQGTVVTTAAPGDAPSSNRDRFYSVTIDSSSEEKKEMAAAEECAGGESAKEGEEGDVWATPGREQRSIPTLHRRKGLGADGSSAAAVSVPQDGGSDGPQQLQDDGTAAAAPATAAVERKRSQSPSPGSSGKFVLLPPGGKKRDALEAYRSRSIPKQVVSSPAPTPTPAPMAPPASAEAAAASSPAPPPPPADASPPHSPKPQLQPAANQDPATAAATSKAVIPQSPRPLLHSRSTPVLSNASGMETSSASPDRSPTRGAEQHRYSQNDSSHPPLAFFDTAESNASLKKLARDVPLLVPDKNGYILSDETLPDSRWTPLLVFVNTRSGPQQGQVIVTQLRRLLNPIQIWDLAEGNPEPILESFLVLSRLRILVCGGDGTVSWIISALEKMDLQRRWPPIAILPLGTGNDLARVHGWGGGYSNESILMILEQITEAYVSLLDRWEATIEDKKGKVRDTKSFMNYFGVGVDAQTALGVHLLRESSPEFFFSRAVNKAWYVVSGAEDAIKESCAGLPEQISLIADGLEIPLPPDSQGIILLNIDSYAGGVPLWSHGTRPRKMRSRRYSEGDYLDKRRRASSIDGHDSNDEFDSDEIARELDYEERRAKITACDKPSSCQDGMLDVVSIRSTFHLGQIKVGLSNAQLVCQCKEATIQLKKKVTVQMDGEPWRQSSCTIRVKRKKDPANMLHRAAAEGGGVETEMAKLLDWAEERQVIDRNVHATLMREFSRRIESKNRQRRVNSQDNLFFSMKRAMQNSSSPSF